MSTHRFIAARRGGRGLPLLSMLGGLLILLQLLLAPTAFAAAGSAAVTQPTTQQMVLDLSGVSIVRLSLTYSAPKAKPTTCTTLGTIIASWPATTSIDKNNWVLTDGSLLATGKKNTCSPNESLSAIAIYASNEFTNNQPLSALLDTLSCSSTGVCSDMVNGATGQHETLLTPQHGAVIFSFHTAASLVLPYLALDTTPASTGSSVAIELARSITNNALPPSATNVDPTTLPQYLTPIVNTARPGSVPTSTTATATVQTSEPGMPSIGSDGMLMGMQASAFSTPVTVAGIQDLEKEAAFPQQPALGQNLSRNTLNTNWKTGITQYEQGNYKDAIKTLNLINNTQSLFQAPASFVKLAQEKSATGNNGATGSTTNGQGNQGAPTFTGWVLIVGLAAGVLVLILLFLLVSILFGRKRIERKRDLDSFKADATRARQSVDRMETPQQFASLQQYGGVNNPVAPIADLRCPNCQAPIEENATYCPNCRYVFSPSDSGLHRFAMPPAAPALTQPQMPPQPLSQEVYAPAPQSRPESEIPTVEFPDRNGNGLPESEATKPYDVRQLQAGNLGLVVVTETDRGIKRKHKPNEDSIFAVQMARAHNSQPQQIGLFVVADGMGGHANGQDASRLAMQNIIDYIIPRISVGTSLNDEGYRNLLVQGVQNANMAVHQRNMEAHADMGTTMTAALVVGATAYIANVGDSRTYLYREPEGLQKITHDHSVVASLVDAGIIKPDDIYTHPKRNQIYRSLGEKPVVEVDSFVQPLQANDKLLLCSDGLWDMVRDPEIQRVINMSEPNPMQLGKNLIQAALDGGGEDNVSVIVVSITETSGHTGMTGIHLHAKPDTVTVPDLPQV